MTDDAFPASILTVVLPLIVVLAEGLGAHGIVGAKSIVARGTHGIS